MHYKANIGHSSSECFKYFGDENGMFAWISERVGETITTFEECEDWTRRQDDEFGLYIEVIEIENIYDYFNLRKTYLKTMQNANDCLAKARHGRNVTHFLSEFNRHYELAFDIMGLHPEVWQGEI